MAIAPQIAAIGIGSQCIPETATTAAMIVAATQALRDMPRASSRSVSTTNASSLRNFGIASSSTSTISTSPTANRVSLSLSRSTSPRRCSASAMAR